MSNKSEKQYKLAPEPDPETYRRNAGTMKMAAISMGVVAAAGVGAKVYHHLYPKQPRSPIERHGDHQGVTHNTQPGTGTLHTKSGDFHVTQK